MRLFSSEICRLGRVVVGLALASMGALGCARPEPRLPTATPDYPALETRVAQQLGATMTAKAPLPTETPWPTATVPNPFAATHPTPSPSPTPSAAIGGPLLAFARPGPGEGMNIVVRRALGSPDEILTHLTDPTSISDVTWSRDGQWIAFVSSHDFIHSRNNERNVFTVRADGTELRMVTGDYLAPEDAVGPFAVLEGQVQGASGNCLISAQGVASPVEADAQGRFELPGVSTTARWARAVCQNDAQTLQGDADLLHIGGRLAPVTLEVKAEGRGWRRVSLSPSGTGLAGTYYTWALNAEAQPQFKFLGMVGDLQTNTWVTLPILPEHTFMGLDWSPLGGVLVAALAQEKGTFLWHFAPDGSSLGSLVDIPNPEQEILSATNPTWSPDGQRIAFELRHQYWWAGDRYKTEIMLVSADGKDLHPVVTTDWGADAVSASFSADGGSLYYQLSTGQPGDDFQSKLNGDIYLKVLDGSESLLLTHDGLSYSPAANPLPQPEGVR